MVAASVKRIFLSTPSARRATQTGRSESCPLSISIHALREEGDEQHIGWVLGAGIISIHALREEGDYLTLRKQIDEDKISIHALREEGDSRFRARTSALRLFLSTPSARRATQSDKVGRRFNHISIHALREEGDVP